MNRSVDQHYDVLSQLRVANRVRCFEVFKHTIEDWSPTDWATAVAGETGELCNLIKKLRRGDQVDKRNGDSITPELIGKEAADIVAYLDLLCQRIGVNLSVAVVNKFNEVSDQAGSQIKIYYY